MKTNRNSSSISFFLIMISLGLVSAADPLILSEVKDVYLEGDSFLVNASVQNAYDYPISVNLDSFLFSDDVDFASSIIPFEFDLSGGES